MTTQSCVGLLNNGVPTQRRKRNGDTISGELGTEGRN